MDNIFLYLEKSTMLISNIVWPVFIPFLLLVGTYICAHVIFNIKSMTTIKSEMNLKCIIPQASVALGAMMGTGTIIGFLGALSKLADSGQVYVEAVAIWALIGSIVLVPISYCETLIAKVVNMSPKEYIGKFISKKASVVYVIALILLYVFSIGGVQIAGIDAIVITILDKGLNIQLTEIERYLYIAIPVVVVVAIIVLNNRQDIFVKSMIVMILVAVIVYFVFFALFISKTSNYIPIFIDRMIIGFKNPTSALFGIPLGLIFGMQRVIQIAEPGLGTLAIAANKSNSDARVSALISLILTMILIAISIVVTSYIASYGMNEGIITFSDIGVYKLVSYFDTVITVTGGFGLIILFIFIILSGMTTLLGGYFLLNNILIKDKKSKNCIYIFLIFLGATLAVFKFDMIFNILEILLFIAISLNITALAMFTEFEWKKYKLKNYNFKKVVSK